jgi:hypothetical protein
MSVPASRDDLKDWCLRQLGHPVIEINVDDDQVDDRIDEAIQYYTNFHHDGTERWYMAHQFTDQDLINKYLPIADNIIGVTRIFSFTNSASVNMFDLRYQLRLHDLYNFTSTSIVHYALTMQHLRLLDIMFVGEAPIRFNRHTSKLFIDWDWKKAVIGDWLVMEGYIIVNPDTYTKVYNDRMLKKLATALIKRQWGNNMKKFGGMQLPGGIIMNGQQVFDEAQLEIKDIEMQIRAEYEEPPMFLVG